MKRSLLPSWKQKAGELKVQTYALYLAMGDARTPWYARVFAGLVAAYAFSPIDLIPDFIPVLGYLDDLVIVPLGVYLTLRLIPSQVMADCRQRAMQRLEGGDPPFRFMGVVIVVVWIAMAA